MILSQEDFDVRAQLIHCCIATKASQLIPKIRIGASDAHCKLIELQVMKEMLESVLCYQIVDPTPIPGDIHASWLIVKNFFNPIPQNTTFYVDGIAISNAIPIDGFAANMITLIVNDINSFQSDYFAVRINNSRFTVTDVTGTGAKEFTYVTVDPEGTVMTINDTSTQDPEIIPEPAVNCLTETEVIAMFNYLAKKCNLCFPIPGFSRPLVTGETFLRDDINDNIRITVDGFSRTYIH